MMCPFLPKSRPAAPGRPKDVEKGAAILDAAKRLFVTHGFEGVSMDQIAADAGVSKLTVYSHYGDKETLFAAAAKAYCEQQLPGSMFESRPDVPLRERLLQIARAFFAMVCSPEAVAGHRVLCTPRLAESPVPRMFWEAGPQRVQDAFAELLRRRIAAGELAIDDVPRASAQFFALLKGEPHAQLVFGCAAPAEPEIEEHLAASVDLFLRAYAQR
ncbi:MAG: TetR/AcrR family transcriptional regulator [Lysobacter sp.]|nr:TetR/AcrR family transcriptional regulator [Lysobacter sp.]